MLRTFRSSGLSFERAMMCREIDVWDLVWSEQWEGRGELVAFSTGEIFILDAPPRLNFQGERR